MSQIFDKDGQVIPVTLIEAGPCRVAQVKTKEKDGYQAVQIDFEGHLKEFAGKDLKNGQQIDVSIFQEGEIVKIAGISKGKGFQGVVKRHGFSGFPASHGTKHGLRAPGSIGSSFPERVWKGRKMAGRTGAERVMVQGLKIVQVDKENSLLAVKGAVPGRKGALLEIVTTKENENNNLQSRGKKD